MYMRVSACSADGFWSKSTDLGPEKESSQEPPPLATPLAQTLLRSHSGPLTERVTSFDLESRFFMHPSQQYGARCSSH